MHGMLRMYDPHSLINCRRMLSCEAFAVSSVLARALVNERVAASVGYKQSHTMLLNKEVQERVGGEMSLTFLLAKPISLVFLA